MLGKCNIHTTTSTNNTWNVAHSCSARPRLACFLCLCCEAATSSLARLLQFMCRALLACKPLHTCLKAQQFACRFRNVEVHFHQGSHQELSSVVSKAMSMFPWLLLLLPLLLLPLPLLLLPLPLLLLPLLPLPLLLLLPLLLMPATAAAAGHCCCCCH